MKTALLVILSTFILLSCNKENSSKMSEETLPLKAIPSASVNGKVITLLADKSTGALIQYGWQLEDSSPTEGPVTYSPSSSHKGADFVPIAATVTRTGTFTFRLTVYNGTGQDHAFLNVDVK